MERFCDHLKATLPRLDIIVNNACQTVRRPASYYAHLLPLERSVDAVLRLGSASQEHASFVPLLADDATRRAMESQSPSSEASSSLLPSSGMLESDSYYPTAAEPRSSKSPPRITRQPLPICRQVISTSTASKLTCARPTHGY